MNVLTLRLVSKLACAQPRVNIISKRLFVEGKFVIKKPIQPPFSTPKINLWRHVLFSMAFCGTVFCGAALFDRHERRLSSFDIRKSLRLFISAKKVILSEEEFASELTTLQIIRRFFGVPENFAEKLTPGQVTCGSIITTNVVVFLAWSLAHRYPASILSIMDSLFLHYPPANRFLPIIGSIFSHSSTMHLAFNSVSLWSFGPFIHDHGVGRAQFLAFYVSAGVCAALASSVWQRITRQYHSSLGASGAIYALLMLLSMKAPDLSVLLFFMIPLKLGQGMAAMVLFDIAGMIFRFTKMDHAAHLGGAMFGYFYACHGLEMWKHRDKNLLKLDQFVAKINIQIPR